MTETEQRQTVGQWLEALAAGNESTEQDDVKMQNMLRRIGFPQAVSVCGITYFDGAGTLEAPPMPIQAVAVMLLKAAQK